MGGDNAPLEMLKGVIDAKAELGGEYLLVGHKEQLETVARENGLDISGFEILHAETVVTMEDDAMAFREKKDSSMTLALRAVANGEGDAMLSMGSTGALLTAGLLVVGRIKGVVRPALATVLPTAKGPKLLIDAGANTNCKPVNLVQFGVMGDVYMKNLHAIEIPRVGLVSNGEEEGKGDDLTKKTYPEMKKAPFNFIGNIEGRDIMEGNADVIVCDGFVGNVVLKTVEGMGKVISNKVKGIFNKNIFTKLSALFVIDGIKDFKKTMDYREYGGAPLLGCKKLVIKGHGSSDTRAAFCAIKQAKIFVDTNVNKEIEENLAKLNTEDTEDA